jgi:hypothetical protein
MPYTQIKIKRTVIPRAYRDVFKEELGQAFLNARHHRGSLRPIRQRFDITFCGLSTA